MRRGRKRGEINGWMGWKRTWRRVVLEDLGQVEADDWLWLPRGGRGVVVVREQIS